MLLALRLVCAPLPSPPLSSLLACLIDSSMLTYSVLGSLAAGAQSAIGNVAAGSVFATMQSAGAGGGGLAAVNGATQFGAAAAWMAGNANATVSWFKSQWELGFTGL